MLSLGWHIWGDLSEYNLDTDALALGMVKSSTAMELIY